MGFKGIFMRTIQTDFCRTMESVYAAWWSSSDSVKYSPRGPGAKVSGPLGMGRYGVFFKGTVSRLDSAHFYNLSLFIRLYYKYDPSIFPG
jgi:hypothetical protein